jgi:DNA primase
LFVLAINFPYNDVMPLYNKESLDQLRQRIDLVEVMSPYVDFKRSGASYKALCPFHDEKTPSFMIQKGDRHYHCFGCGAHGDAIQFLMTHLKMNFKDAVESLAERFHVHLEHVEGGEEYKGPNKIAMRDALQTAAEFYHFYLLHTAEGQEALKYLQGRGIDLDFIRRFQIGLAPKAPGIFQKIMQEKKVPHEILIGAGLLAESSKGGYRDFFYDRITFPIHHSAGSIIGFSARKYKEDTFGGKYVNTSETPLFKKSRILYGLNYCRRKIAKERKAIVVEGQIDALRLIYSGFDITVASQGTAFGEGHVKELLTLGINRIYLCMDSDTAGKEAAAKVGDLFQKEGIEVVVVQLPQGLDPDSFILKNGPEEFQKLLDTSGDYITFIVDHHSQTLNVETPAGKNELVQSISKQIRLWTHPLMVHESLRKLAQLTHVPEEMVGLNQHFVPNIHIRKSGSIGIHQVDPDRIIESDFLRWLLIMPSMRSRFIEIAQLNLSPDQFHQLNCSRIYKAILDHPEVDIFSLMSDPDDQRLISETMEKKVNLDKPEQQFAEAIKKILDRNWMERRQEVNKKMQDTSLSEDDSIALVKEFVELTRNPPVVLLL